MLDRKQEAHCFEGKRMTRVGEAMPMRFISWNVNNAYTMMMKKGFEGHRVRLDSKTS